MTYESENVEGNPIPVTSNLEPQTRQALSTLRQEYGNHVPGNQDDGLKRMRECLHKQLNLEYLEAQGLVNKLVAQRLVIWKGTETSSPLVANSNEPSLDTNSLLAPLPGANTSGESNMGRGLLAGLFSKNKSGSAGWEIADDTKPLTNL